MSTEYTHIFAYFRQYAQIFYSDVLKTDFAEKFYLKKKRHTVYRVPVFG